MPLVHDNLRMRWMAPGETLPLLGSSGEAGNVMWEPCNCRANPGGDQRNNTGSLLAPSAWSHVLSRGRGSVQPLRPSRLKHGRCNCLPEWKENQIMLEMLRRLSDCQTAGIQVPSRTITAGLARQPAGAKCGGRGRGKGGARRAAP